MQKRPQRMCVACRRTFDKRELLRVVKTPDGLVAVDATGKRDGRGAYICADENCLRKCEKGLLKKHLGCDIPAEVFTEIHTIRQHEN